MQARGKHRARTRALVVRELELAEQHQQARRVRRWASTRGRQQTGGVLSGGVTIAHRTGSATVMSVTAAPKSSAVELDTATAEVGHVRCEVKQAVQATEQHLW